MFMPSFMKICRRVKSNGAQDSIYDAAAFNSTIFEAPVLSCSCMKFVMQCDCTHYDYKLKPGAQSLKVTRHNAVVRGEENL
jgi:hypothetical protein